MRKQSSSCRFLNKMIKSLCLMPCEFSVYNTQLRGDTIWMPVWDRPTLQQLPFCPWNGSLQCTQHLSAHGCWCAGGSVLVLFTTQAQKEQGKDQPSKFAVALWFKLLLFFCSTTLFCSDLFAHRAESIWI